MRGPNEIEQSLARAAAPGQPPLPVVPGGKALQRLHQFELERNIEQTDELSGQPARPIQDILIYPPEEGGEEAAAPAPPAESPYLLALQERQRAEMEEAVTIEPAWVPLGPFSIPHGQTYGSGPGSRPSVAGRVSAIAIDPGDPAHILIGAAAGGIWETRDTGATWRPRSDHEGTLTVGAIAFDPQNPATVFAGTGEGNFYSQLGTGILRSTDGGANWTTLAANPFSGLGFYDLQIDPLDPQHMLAATTAHLAESTDGGATWTVRRSSRTWQISVHSADPGDPDSTREVFAACGDGLQRSTDGGATWAPVGLPGVSGSFARLAVCHAPSNGDVVYAFGAMGGAARVWRRDTFGGAFNPLTPPAGLNVNQAWYDWFAAAAPDNADILYLGAIDAYKGQRSASGAWSWAPVSARPSGQSIHPDQHAIAFSPADPNVVYIGNDGGIYRSPDGGDTWQSLNKGLCIMEVEYLAQHPLLDTWMIAGTQDNGTMRYEGCEVWPHVADGDGGDCGINTTSPATCYHSYYGMSLERSNSGGNWGSWTWVAPPAPSGYNALFYPPMEVNGSNVAQAGQSVFISMDAGDSWTEIALPGAAGVCSALAIPSNTRLLAGTTTGRIYRIDRSGLTWGPAVAMAQPRSGYLSDIAVDPTNPDRLWVTFSSLFGGHVFRSDDGGSSWTNVSSGLPDIAANAIALDPANTDRVYVGMDVGVYRSLDAGSSWTLYSNGLPNAIVGDLLFHPSGRLLRAGTRSRGAWEIAVDDASIFDVQLYLRDSAIDSGRSFPSPDGADPFFPPNTTFWWNSTDIKVDSAPFQFLALVDFEVFEDDHGVFASGLMEETAQGQARVYVQVHNRGPVPASPVTVSLYYCDAAGFTSLPEGFWTDFPNNSLPPGSAWQPLAAPRVIPQVETGRPQVAAFDWQAPANTSGQVWLLAILTADNDPVTTTELDVTQLVLNNPKAALKQVMVAPFSGVQWTGSVPANSTRRWFTHSWPAGWHVIWTVVPTTPVSGAPQIRYQVQVERASPEFNTYWISITNLTHAEVGIEGRYCVLSIG